MSNQIEFDRKKTYYKILRQDLTHYGFKYQVGLNVDTVPFNPKGSCEPGGLYFTDKENLHEYFVYGTLIADIRIPKDAQVYQARDENKWKADKIEILSITPRHFHTVFNTYEYWLGAVQKNGNVLQFVPEELKDQYICLAAVQQYGCAMDFVPDKFKTKVLYKIALQDYGYYLKKVPEELKSYNLCLIAVQQNGGALEFVPLNLCDYEMCRRAVEQNGSAFQYVPDEIKDGFICIRAVQQSGHMLEYVPEKLKTKEICLAAVRQLTGAIKYVPDKFKKEIEDILNIKSNYIICSNESDIRISM